MKSKIRRGIQENNANKVLSTPCTIAEAVQIARGVAEDVVAESQSRAQHLQVAMSLQMEILKDIVVKAGLITEEEFKERYIEQAEIFNKMQQEAMNSEVEEQDDHPSTHPQMDVSVGDVEITKVQGE